MRELKIENLSHVYSKGTPFEKTAIDNVSLDIKAGQFVSLIGHTGSGKSTLIQHLNGLLTPTCGKIFCDGKDINETKQAVRDIRFKVGLVFQYPEYQLFEDTVYDDIAFGPKNMKLSVEEIDRQVRLAAMFVGISESEFQKSPLELSGGQKRRVAIAGVIAMRPGVLILDEPTAGLDPAGRESILKNIRDYHRNMKSTVIYVTHSMEEAARVSDRLIVMSKGRVAMDGTPEQVFSNDRQLTDLGLSVPDVTRIAMALREKGVSVPKGIYTMEQLKAAVLDIFRKGADHA